MSKSNPHSRIHQKTDFKRFFTKIHKMDLNLGDSHTEGTHQIELQTQQILRIHDNSWASVSWPLKTEYTCNFFRCFGVFIRYKNNLFHVSVFRIFRAFKWYVNYYELSNFVLVYECHIYWKLYIINRVRSSLGTDRQRRTMKIMWKIPKVRGTRPS